jgi:hypothetical protein
MRTTRNGLANPPTYRYKLALGDPNCDLSPVNHIHLREEVSRRALELLSAERFSPLVVTSNDGFSIAVDRPKRCLVGARMLVVSDPEGNLYHFPFTGISLDSDQGPGEA